MINPAIELRKRLKKEGCTQREFAAALGVTEGMLSMLLSGKRKPGEDMLRWLGLEKRIRVSYHRVNHHDAPTS